MLQQIPAETLESFGRDMEAIRARVVADLGERDARYIRRLVRIQRRSAIAGRALLMAGVLPPFWLAGTALLSLAKILENMEIGHNVMHGQYDFMKDPTLDSHGYEWDNVCPADQWRHSHNYRHHTFTNVIGQDRDLGYGLMRVTEREPWRPVHLTQPLHAAALALMFEWGVALHDAELERVRSGAQPWPKARAALAGVWRKARKQLLKDYLLFPALAGPFFLPVLLGNLTANVVRNVWAFMVIFCGHFPAGTQAFTEAEVAGETRGGWYVRQLLGSANIAGGPLMHVMTGNLSHQIEHHLFPELPAHRYAEIAVAVRESCARHGLPYNSRGLLSQFGSVVARILRFSLPGPAQPAKPGHYGTPRPDGVSWTEDNRGRQAA